MIAAAAAAATSSATLIPIQYNTIQYMFGIETRPGTSQRADSPLMGSL
jgi:hypothetical protein